MDRKQAGLVSRRTAAATAFTRVHRPGFVHYQSSTLQLAAITAVHGTLCGFVVPNLDESKSASLACETVSHDRYNINADTGTFEKTLNVVLVR